MWENYNIMINLNNLLINLISFLIVLILVCKILIEIFVLISKDNIKYN